MAERQDITIDGSVATWEMNLQGAINGTYIGTFKFRCYLTPTQQIAASREMRELLGPQMGMAPEHETFMAYALTQLKHRVVSAPPFWSSTLNTSSMSGDLPDENIISEVLNAATDAEIKYKNQLKKRKEDALEKAKEAAERMLKIRDEEDKDGEESEDD